MSRFRLFILMGMVLALMAVALPASACSCAGGDPRDMLSESDGAIVGTYVSRRPADPAEEFGDTIYTFEVDEEVKGDFEETLDVHSGSNGASCGFEIEPGATIGMFLYSNEAGEWTSGLCNTISPRGLREAAKPLPAPDGSGPAKLLVAGSFGTARTLVLDARSKTLDYGYGGDRDVTDLALCPGGVRSVEVTQVYDDRRNRWRLGLAVRNVRTQKEVADFPLTFQGERGFRNKWPGTLSCNDRRGREAYLFVTEGYGSFPEGAIFSYRSGRQVDRVDVKARQVLFGRDTAYMSTGKYGRNLVALGLKTGSKETLVEGRRPLEEFSSSPDGTKLVGVRMGHCGEEGCRGWKLVLVDLESGRVRTKDFGRVGDYADTSWWGNRRFVVTGFARRSVSVRSYNTHFEALGRFRDWYIYESVVVKGKLYGVDYGTLFRARLPNGPARRVRRLPSPVTNALVAVPRS
jgi:hypothetical protein